MNNQSIKPLIRSSVNLLISLSIYLLICSPTNPAIASNFDLSLDPPLLKVQIKPGKSITKAFTIENKSDTDQYLIARIAPFEKSDNFGNPLIDLKNLPGWLSYFGLSNTNIELNKPFTIKAKSNEQLILSISIPTNASLKDIYTTLLVSTYSNSLPSEQKGSFVSGTIGSNILISITSSLNPKTTLQVENIQITSGNYFRLGNLYLTDNLTPLSFTANIKNNGDFISEVRGLFKITKGNQPIYLEGILPQNIIAKSVRQITSNQNKNFTFIPEITQFGYHQAIFDIQSENSSSKNSINLLLLPFKAVIGFFISLLLLSILIFRK